MSLLGLDIGTTGAKAVAFSPEGEILASAYQEYPLLSPRPGWQELDPNAVWAAVRAILSEVASKTSHNPIRAMAIASHGEACHPVTREGLSLANALAPFDGRTADMPAWWARRMSRFDIAQITGMPLHGMYTINKILWIKENLPDAYAKAWKFLCFEDFIQFKLGLNPVMSHPMASRTMAFDVPKGHWSSELLKLAGIDQELLPFTAPSGVPVGTIPNPVADEIGLPRGIVVGTGGHDQPVGTLGVGVLESGEAMYATGTVECICGCFDRFRLTPEMVDANICCYTSCVPGLFVSLGFNFTGGVLLKWYRDTFGQQEKALAEATGQDVYDLICSSVPGNPERVLILPHFTMTGTPYFDTCSRGAILGLTLNTPREEVISAILSGVTYEMKLNLELLQSTGVEIRRLRVIGGGAKSKVWVQRKADIMGIPMVVPKATEAACLGAALLGGKAAGLLADFEGAVRSAVQIEAEVEPNEPRQRYYDEMFAIYREVYASLCGINHRLAALEAREG